MCVGHLIAVINKHFLILPLEDCEGSKFKSVKTVEN